MLTAQNIKTSCDTLTHGELLSRIADDFLQFSLKHTFSEQTFTHRLKNGAYVSLLANGILSICTSEESLGVKSIVLSCGIHGNETAPIEICNQLVHSLMNDLTTTPHRLLFIFGNLDSMVTGERFVEENLNRLFSKDIDSQSIEGHRAKCIMANVDLFFESAPKGCERIHWDLHTAIRPSKNEKFAVYPFLHGKPYSKTSLALLSACDVNTILLSQSPTTTFSYYSSLHHGAHAFTVELGKVMPFGENDMSKFTALRRTLHMLLGENTCDVPNFSQCPIEVFTVNQVINKHFDNFTLHFDDNTANFADFTKGQVIASETDPATNTLNEYQAQYEGEAIVFPNAHVAIGQRAILTVIPYEL